MTKVEVIPRKEVALTIYPKGISARCLCRYLKDGPRSEHVVAIHAMLTGRKAQFYMPGSVTIT
jgi:hypothetical protein